MTLQDPSLRIDAGAQRARGALSLRVKAEEGRTRLQDVRQEGSSRLLFPRVFNHSIEAVTLNTAGGITGGDQFAIKGHAGADTVLTLTTQAAERIYKAAGPEPGRFETHLRIDHGARMNWLPQETILFDGSALTRKLDVDLDETGVFLMCEPLVFGRKAAGEALRSAHFRDQVQIRRAGALIYYDAAALSGDIEAQLQRPAIADGAGAMASLVFCSADAAHHCDAVRALLPQTAGASLLSAEVLTIRILAEDSFILRQTLCPLLSHLTDDALPKTWRL